MAQAQSISAEEATAELEANPREVRLTKRALRHAFIPTTHRGKASKVALSARRLILRRRA